MKTFLKSTLKSLAPPAVLEFRDRHAQDRRWRSLLTQWEEARAKVAARKATVPARKLLIFPSDPWTITGAVGDDAMISATVGHFRKLRPDIGVDVICQAGTAEAVVRNKGFSPVLLPGDKRFPLDFLTILQNQDYDAFVVLGADIMDGYYGPEFVARVIIATDLAARSGLDATLLGFSFNDRPEPRLAGLFDALDPSVHVNVRDAISFERFSRFTSARPTLVADSAFTLEPGVVDNRTDQWIAAGRAQGRTIIGFNLHPMLIKDATAGQVAVIIQQGADAILAASRDHDTAWLLLPHDYRQGHGDGVCLRPIHDLLRDRLGDRILYLEGEHRAADLKATAGKLDGVVTGRMHLAIAALGMGVPTLCVTYQDKFEGLYRHFGLPSDLLTPPSTLERPNALGAAVGQFIADLPRLAEIVRTGLPAVSELSNQNFNSLSADGATA